MRTLACAVLLAACAYAPNETPNDNDVSALTSLDGDTVSFTATSSGKCIDVTSASQTAGTQLQQYTCNGTSAQTFELTGGEIINTNSKLCLEVRGNSAANGTAIDQVTCTGAAAQKFTFVGAQIRTDHNSCLDITGKSLANGAKLQQWACTGGTNQAFTPTVLATGNQKSIKQWVACDGTTDDAVGTAAAFAAASAGGFTLLVDCPVRIHIGDDIARPIFIDDNTTVAFTSAGRFYVDNLFVPAFVLAGTTNVTLTNWNVEWDGEMPMDPAIGYYYNNGVKVTATGGNGSGAFNDLILTKWLTDHRHIAFDETKGYVKAIWHGSVNMGAIFYLFGDTSNVRFTGLDLHAPANATADHFLPFGVSFGVNFKNNQTATAVLPMTSQYFEAPHDLVFENIYLDGTLMGFQGNLHDTVFEHVRSHRYSDLQDANGGTVGGIGKYFPPPHLFYLNYDFTGDPSLFNRALTLTDIVDDGVRLGVARDTGTNGTSGFACSLKLGCDDCSVDGYTTSRPDGFMDVLKSDGLTVTNVKASYSSKFLNDVFPGWRYPIGPQKNVTFSNVQFSDTAATADRAPVGNAADADNVNLVLDNVHVSMNTWTGGSLVPTTYGQGDDSMMLFTTTNGPSAQVGAGTRTVTAQLDVAKTTLAAGGTTTVTWTSHAATGCTASWGTVATSGTATIAIASSRTLTLTCNNATDTTTATAVVTATP